MIQTKIVYSRRITIQVVMDQDDYQDIAAWRQMYWDPKSSYIVVRYDDLRKDQDQKILVQYWIENNTIISTTNVADMVLPLILLQNQPAVADALSYINPNIEIISSIDGIGVVSAVQSLQFPARTICASSPQILKLDKIKDDGDCFYHSICTALNDSGVQDLTKGPDPVTVRMVRSAISNAAVSNSDTTYLFTKSVDSFTGPIEKKLIRSANPSNNEEFKFPPSFIASLIMDKEKVVWGNEYMIAIINSPYFTIFEKELRIIVVQNANRATDLEDILNEETDAPEKWFLFFHLDLAGKHFSSMSVCTSNGITQRMFKKEQAQEIMLRNKSEYTFNFTDFERFLKVWTNG